MNCRHLRDELRDVVRNAAGEPTRARVKAHIESCPSCRHYVEQQLALTAGFRALADRAEEEVPSASLEQRVLSTFSDRRTVGTAGPSRQPRSGSRRLPAWLQAAAVLLLAVGGAVVWRLAGPAGIEQARPSLPVAPRVVAAAPVPGPPAPVDPPAHHAVKRPGKSNATAAAASPRTAQASGFTLLPGAASLPEFESGEIVRVELGASALPAYGINIPAGAGETEVQVDLLVGQDGHLRAIRLVTQDMRNPRS